jgi:hypothetical protein
MSDVDSLAFRSALGLLSAAKPLAVGDQAGTEALRGASRGQLKRGVGRPGAGVPQDTYSSLRSHNEAPPDVALRDRLPRRCATLPSRWSASFPILEAFPSMAPEDARRGR